MLFLKKKETETVFMTSHILFVVRADKVLFRNKLIEAREWYYTQGNEHDIIRMKKVTIKYRPTIFH